MPPSVGGYYRDHTPIREFSCREPQTKIESIIAYYCICSKSAAESLLKVETPRGAVSTAVGLEYEIRIGQFLDGGHRNNNKRISDLTHYLLSLRLDSKSGARQARYKQMWL
jgi:hypothetical protein